MKLSSLQVQVRTGNRKIEVSIIVFHTFTICSNKKNTYPFLNFKQGKTNFCFFSSMSKVYIEYMRK